MKVRIKASHKNSYPNKGILIRNSSVSIWVREIQLFGLKLEEIDVYALPGKEANSIWGCLVVSNQGETAMINNPHPVCQVINNRIFIPSYSKLYPSLSSDELERLFPNNIFLLHPEIGFVELEQVVEWHELLSFEDESPGKTIKPSKGVYLTDEIKSFLVHEAPVEDVLKNLDENVFPKKEHLEDKPLSEGEKVKLSFLSKLFKKDNPEGKDKIEKTSLLKAFEGFAKLFGKEKKWTSKLKEDYKDLEERNQKTIDKLLNMFKDDPEEALKRAIPLDEYGTTRGTDQAPLDLSKKWGDLSLSDRHSTGNSNSGGSGIIPDNHFDILRKQYHDTARKLIKEGDHHKAAFIYLKLLKNYKLAAQTLEQGKHYAEAAAIYLKYLQDKQSAANCYEQGNMTTQAIEIYKELNSDEKVADLYMKINQVREAHVYYEKVVSKYAEQHHYIKASDLLKNKMDNPERSQALLMEGWTKQADAFNCLNLYFSDFPDEKLLIHEIQSIYNQTNRFNKETFLKVLVKEYHRQRSSAEKARDIAYEIISEQFKVNPSIGSQLKAFNKDDQVLMKDVLRHRRSDR